MKRIVISLLLSISGLYANDAQIEAGFRSLSKELDDLRESGNNVLANQESFAAYIALVGFCDAQRPISEKVLNKLKELNFLDENGNVLPNVCSVIKKVTEQTEKEQEK